MPTLTNISAPISAALLTYRSLFEQALTSQEDFLRGPLDYLKARQGKMMRPMLTLLVASDLGEVSQAAYRCAVTLEVLHTASLVHDDVVDESALRRGMKSTPAVYGNQVAVLLGDYLLSVALQQSALTESLDCVKLVAKLGATLSEGELYQLSRNQQEEMTEEAYFRIIRGKTAELFAACARMGARAMQASDSYTERAARFGELVGLCFQVRDDIFDYFSDESIGKPTGNDMAEGKLTLPVIYALRTACDAEAQTIAARVRSHQATPDEIDRLLRFAREHGGIDYAEQTMARLCAEAEELLPTFHRAETRTALRDYLHFVVGRKS